MLVVVAIIECFDNQIPPKNNGQNIRRNATWIKRYQTWYPPRPIRMVV